MSFNPIQQKLIHKLSTLMNDPIVYSLVDKRVEELSAMQQKNSLEWFSELAFCILTANSKAETGLKIQQSLNVDGFLTLSIEDLRLKLKTLGHRFYNKRAEYIVDARKYAKSLKDIILSFDNLFKAREWLVKNVKGISYKESSHFLRNVGFFNFAIVDRHILKILYKYDFIDSIPKSISKRKYLEIEQIFFKIAENFDMKPGILDFYIWYMSTGKVLK